MSSISNDIRDSLTSLKRYASQSEKHRVEVRDALRTTISDIETPFDQLHEITFAGPALASILQACLDMNLFSLWNQSDGGPRSIEELADITKTDPILLARLLRHLAAMNKIKEVGTYRYAPTAFTEALGKPGISNGIRLLYHSTWPVLAHLPKFLKAQNYQNPTNAEDTNWHDMTGSKVGWFEQLELDKDSGRLLDFQNVMQMYANTGNWAKLYPTEQLFDGYDPQKPLLVDAGGGKGQNLELFLEKHPNLAKESLILEELPSVVENIDYNLDPSIKIVPHDLVQPQRVKGARAYFTHSVFHGWTDEEAVPVLKNIAAAMTKGYSKLLLNEKIVPAEGATRTAATGDVIMMATFSASERTVAIWESLFAKAGLQLIKVWQTPIYPEAIIEAELKDVA